MAWAPQGSGAVSPGPPVAPIVRVARSAARWWARALPHPPRAMEGGVTMLDVLYIGLAIGFLVLSWRLVELCDRL